MPRHIDRNFLPLAQAQNRLIWNNPPSYGISPRHIAALEASSDRQQARYLRERRERLVEAINGVSAKPALYWNASYFRYLRGASFVDTADAVREVLSSIAWWENRPRYGRRPDIIAELGEALVFARYFRRFASRLWARRAA